MLCIGILLSQTLITKEILLILSKDLEVLEPESPPIIAPTPPKATAPIAVPKA